MGTVEGQQLVPERAPSRCTVQTGIDIDGEPLTCGRYGCHGGEHK
ncbi:hypothetical protein [Streptomyces hydrogenans]